MGYDFSFERPDVPRADYRLNSAEMSILVEVMREVGAIREQGCYPNYTLLPEGVPQAKFQSNGNQHVTPDECRLIARKLRDGLANGTVTTTLSFFDDAPYGAEAVRWVEGWIDYNERAADAGGYRVN